MQRECTLCSKQKLYQHHETDTERERERYELNSLWAMSITVTMTMTTTTTVKSIGPGIMVECRGRYHQPISRTGILAQTKVILFQLRDGKNGRKEEIRRALRPFL